MDMPKNDLGYCQIFMELFVFERPKMDSLQSTTAEFYTF